MQDAKTVVRQGRRGRGVRPGAWAAGAALACAALLAGCASMSEGQCLRADWYERGLEDGRDGRPATWLDAHRQACAKAGVQPDGARWRAGWQEGNRAYCMPRSGWQAGAQNRGYAGACRDRDEDAFMRAYAAGQAVWRTRQELQRNWDEVERLELELRRAAKDEERQRIRQRLAWLDVERRRLRLLLETQELSRP
jgi:hypothetical protein